MIWLRGRDIGLDILSTLRMARPRFSSTRCRGWLRLLTQCFEMVCIECEFCYY